MGYILDRMERQEDRIEAVAMKMDSNNQIYTRLLRKLQSQISVVYHLIGYGAHSMAFR